MLLNEIGEGTSALYCLTNRTNCCHLRGLWRNPKGGDVRDGLYITRGFSSLRLNRRSGGRTGPEVTGVHICRIPDAGNALKTLSIGIYNSKF